MIRRAKPVRGRVALFGAVLASLVAMSAMAAAAQAAEWTINGGPMEAYGLSSETVSGSGGPTTISAPTLGVKVSCTSESDTSTLTLEGKSTDTLTLSGCTVTEPSNCILSSSSIVMTAAGSVVESGGSLYRKLVGANGIQQFGSIKLNECAYAGSYPITGSFTEGVLGSNLVSQKLSFSSAAGTVLKLGGSNTATITGGTTQQLSGPRSGSGWGAMINPPPSQWWKVNGSLLKGSSAVTASGGSSVIDIPAIGFKIGCSGTGFVSAAITNGVSAAESSGRLNLTGCAVIEPVGCTVGKTITTESLSGSLKLVKSTVYEVWKPISGTLIKLTIGGCAISGSYAITGSFAGRDPLIGTERTDQELEFSSAIDSAAGVGLTMGPWGKVTITGGVHRTLSSGLPWGTA